MHFLESFCAAKQDCKAILLPMILYVFSARCYIPPSLYLTPSVTHTYKLPPQRLSSWLERAIETSGKGKRNSKKRQRYQGYSQTHILSPVSMTKWTLEGECGDESCAQYGTDYREKLHKLITAVAPGVVYEKYQLPLKEMKYKTLLMNPNGLPFP